MNDLEQRMQRMYNLLDEEQMRVKRFINENGLDCTTAAFAIAKRYRDELKAHMKILRMNMDD